MCILNNARITTSIFSPLDLNQNSLYSISLDDSRILLFVVGSVFTLQIVVFPYYSNYFHLLDEKRRDEMVKQWL